MTKIILAALASVTLLNSCTQYQAQGAGIGALGGAAVGALAGDRRDAARGAVIGAALGTGIAAAQENARRRNTPPSDDGYYRGDDRYRDDYRQDYRDDRYDERPRQTQRQEYPYAERTSNPNRVISPYGPDYNVIDVSGFKSGQLAKDPSNGKIFRVP